VPGLVLVIEDELLFSARIETGLRVNGFQPRLVDRAEQIGEALKAFPVLVLVNVGAPNTHWQELLQMVRAGRPGPPPVVVGYGPHTDLESRRLALAAGCAAVVARSAAANDLGSLLRRYAWTPDRMACEQAPPAGVLKGIDQFNSKAFFRCHDSIEAEWVEEKGDVRYLYQGLLQISVGFYHVQRRNLKGAQKMLERGKGKLLPFLPDCQGIDVKGLLAQVDNCEADLLDVLVNRLVDESWFPQIQLVQ
jgi:predicted metal-dependent hydrolase